MAAIRKPWLRPLLIGLAAFALAAAFMSYVFFFEWTEVRDALPPEAQRAFAAALVESGGGTPYIEVTAGGPVVHRDQEGNEPRGFATLKLLAWSATERKIVRVEYPRWFVWLKTSSAFNLGTIISTVRRDWGHLDLSVTYRDLTLRGPGLLLDERMASGSRIMLWTTE